MRKFCLLVLLSVCAQSLLAQRTFRYTAALPRPDTSAFFKIRLSPDLLAKCNADLSDLRIANKTRKFLPFIFGDQLPVKDQANFVSFKQVGNVADTDTSSVLIVENTGQFAIDQLYIKFRNTSVQRLADLSGSDDLKKWYAIKENIALQEKQEPNSGSFQQMLNFPLSTYRYFKIRVNHKNLEPVSILAAGIHQSQSAIPAYVKLPSPGLIQKDSANKSLIHVSLKDNYTVNKIRFEVTGARFYKRDIRIYDPGSNRHDLIYYGTISSAAGQDILLSVKTRAMDVEIENADDPPLSIKAIEVSQLEQTLITYLEKGQQYKLLFGDTAATAPDYDLRFFTDSLQRPLPSVDHGKVVMDPLYNVKPARPARSMPQWIIWLAIVAVLLILGWLTLKMTQEVKNKAD